MIKQELLGILAALRYKQQAVPDARLKFPHRDAPFLPSPAGPMPG